MTKKIVIFGYGYTAQAFTKLLRHHEFTICGTTRDAAKIDRLQSNHVQLVNDVTRITPQMLSGASHILVSIPPMEDGSDTVLTYFKNVLQCYKENIQWIGYLSSTGVYGDHQGAWVTEKSPLNKPSIRALKRIQVEKAWMSLYQDAQLPVHIFRLAGIYGPGRNSLKRILDGKDYSIVKKDQIFSRVHVDDIAGALFASLQKPTPGEVYNVADDCPAASQDIDAYATTLLNKPGLKQVPIEQAALSEMAREFYRACRRVSNEKLKQNLSYQFKYPSYKEGLAAELATFAPHFQ